MNKSVIAILVITLLLILLPCAYAANRVVFSQFVNEQETAKTELGDFYVRYYDKQDQQDTMVIEKMDKSGFRMLIDDGECEFFEQYKFCFYGSQAGTHDYEKDIDITAVKLHIEELTPGIARTFSKRSLMLGEEAEVKVTMTIPEDRRASVSYTDKFPEGFKISSSKAIVTANTVTYNGNVDGVFEFTYNIKLIDPEVQPYKSKGTFTYNFEGKTGTLATDEVEIQKQNDLNVEIEFEPEEAEIGDQVELEINLDKSVSEKLDVNRLELIFPKGTQFVQTDSDFEQVGESHIWKNTQLTDDKEYKYIITQNADSNYTVKLIAETERDGNVQYQEKAAVLLSSIADLDLGFTFPSMISYPKNVKLRAYYENKNEKTSFKNIKCSITGDIFNKEYSFENSLAGVRTNIADEYLKLTDISPRNISHTFKCTYQLPSGRTNTVETKKESQINTSVELAEEEPTGEDGLDRKIGFKEEENESEDIEMESEDTGGIEIGEDDSGFFNKIINWFKSLFSDEDNENRKDSEE